MIKRKVIITRNCNLSDARMLVEHSAIKKHWLLPYEHSLFEFSHPAFQLTRDARFATAPWDAMTRGLAQEAINEERKLLRPLFASLVNPSDAVMLLVPATKTVYEFIGKEKRDMQWPDLGLSPDWDLSKHCRVAGRLRLDVIASNVFAPLQRVLIEWQESLQREGVEVTYSELVFVGSYFRTNMRCPELCGDASMALYLLLAVTMLETRIQSVGFFDEDDFEAPFLEIGGPRKTDQIRG